MISLSISSCLLQIGLCYVMYEPSFVSEWYEATSDNKSLSLLTITHNLGEYPVKVDVQVKITEGGQDYIFSGIGASQRDDDLNYEYGGVVYIYNQRFVKLGFPFAANSLHLVSRGLAYTGYGTRYDGPSILDGPYINGFVRVRAWLAIDMPPPVINMSTFISRNEGDFYKELSHGLGSYPDIVTVQTLLPNGYMSDGIGVVFFGNSSKWSSLSGVLFGYDDTKIRLWVPCNFFNHTSGGFVFAAHDGYFLGAATRGTAYILGWQHDGSQQVFYSEQIIGATYHSILNLPFSINLTTHLVSVQYKIPVGDGLNGGMLFYAAGTTQATTRYKYGGLVYVYNEQQVLLWLPNRSPLVYIGDRWGGGQWEQQTDNVEVIVRVYSLRKSECPYPELPGNVTVQVSGLRYNDMVVYSCSSNYLHLGGDLVRRCQRNRRWDGTIPACVLCPKEFNASSTMSEEEMQRILKEMRVSKKDTGAYRRSLISAPDKRLSAKVMGLFGVCILVSITCILFFPDIASFIMHMRDYSSINRTIKRK